MTSFCFFAAICIAVAFQTASASGPCDIIQSLDWPGIGSIKICFMQSTAIDSDDFMITSPHDVTVEGFSASNNKDLKFLPRNIGKRFPNLIILDASSCSLKGEITKEKFEGLRKLRKLNLQNNQIEKIATFKGIPAVEQIFLDGNKITKLNGQAFDSLKKLEYVDLRNNTCINEYYSSPASISRMPPIVTSKCGFKEDPICGVSNGESVLSVTNRIIGGENFGRGDFPWMVALYQRRGSQTNYFCGGSVISDHHVLTAAHCMKGLVPTSITVVFGVYDLDNQSEVGRFTQSPSRMFVHEDWKDDGKYDADIAMLLMSKKIVFSAFVQPICLWNSQTPPTISTGTVPGWGQSQNTLKSHETIPTKLELPIHTNEDCFLKFSHLTDLSSKRTFCAGSADGKGPCQGDSGGGFYVEVGGVSYLRGIVSAAWDVDIYGNCLLQMYTTYTDVVKYKPWIDEKMQRN